MPTTPLARAPADASHNWVLHLVPPNGGGVDRFVRDLWTQRPHDAVLHVTDAQWVLEMPGHRFTALSAHPKDLATTTQALGRPAWLHAHAVSPAVRQAAQHLVGIMACPLAVTLHDITFTHGTAEEQATALRFIQQARVLTAPSHYLQDVLARQAAALGAAIPPCTLLLNGTAPMAATAGAHSAPMPCRFDLAVVGAMGAHKGLQHLLDVCAALPPGRRIALIGYADGQLTPGWKVPDRLWVHGPFEPDELPALLHCSGASWVFFPAGQPESFCYALSDVWQAGWPVLVPDQGALGERVRRHGRGQVYDPALSPQSLAGHIERLLAAAPVPPGTTAPEPTLADMAAQLALLYQMTPDQASTSPPQADELARLAQQHLDGHFFRQELLRLRGDLEAVRRENASLRDELQGLSQAHEARGEWIRKLEGDTTELQQALRREQAQFAWLRRALARWNALTGQ